ncbi:MAG: hypothetical protein WCQ23_01325 [Candidatus Methanomethylophilaceae archaeon]|jgi:predicted Na+-dependent transporter
MAKKKRRITEEPIEEYEFKPAEFDEREFIYKDIHGTKILGVIMVFAIAFGIFGAVVCTYGPDWTWMVVSVLAFAVAFSMKKVLMKMKFRPDLLDAKSMYANYFLFLCLALGVCILFVNPPFL